MEEVKGAVVEVASDGETAPVAAAPTTGRDRLKRYVWSAVRRETDRVAQAPEGTRNDTVYVAAVNLGSLVGAGMLAEADARDALLVGVRMAENPLPSFEAERAIDSGLGYGRQHPRQLHRGDG